jgi:hypothetical protein
MMYGHVPEDTPVENLYELVRAMVVIAQSEAEGNLSHHKMAPGSRARFQPSKEWYERRDDDLRAIQEDAREFLAEFEEHFAPRLGHGARIKTNRRMVKT